MRKCIQTNPRKNLKILSLTLLILFGRILWETIKLGTSIFYDFFNPNYRVGGGSSSSIGESRFLHNQTSGGPKTSLETRIWTLWSSRKKNRALYLSRYSRGGQTKIESTIFQKRNWDFWRFLRMFNKIPAFSKHSQGLSLKARDLKFWNLVIHIPI